MKKMRIVALLMMVLLVATTFCGCLENPAVTNLDTKVEDLDNQLKEQAEAVAGIQAAIEEIAAALENQSPAEGFDEIKAEVEANKQSVADILAAIEALKNELNNKEDIKEDTEDDHIKDLLPVILPTVEEDAKRINDMIAAFNPYSATSIEDLLVNIGGYVKRDSRNRLVGYTEKELQDKLLTDKVNTMALFVAKYGQYDLADMLDVETYSKKLAIVEKNIENADAALSTLLAGYYNFIDNNSTITMSNVEAIKMLAALNDAWRQGGRVSMEIAVPTGTNSYGVKEYEMINIFDKHKIDTFDYYLLSNRISTLNATATNLTNLAEDAVNAYNLMFELYSSNEELFEFDKAGNKCIFSINNTIETIDNKSVVVWTVKYLTIDKDGEFTVMIDKFNDYDKKEDVINVVKAITIEELINYASNAEKIFVKENNDEVYNDLVSAKHGWLSEDSTYGLSYVKNFIITKLVLKEADAKLIDMAKNYNDLRLTVNVLSDNINIDEDIVFGDLVIYEH